MRNVFELLAVGIPFMLAGAGSGSVAQEAGEANVRRDAAVGLKEGWRKEIEIGEVKRENGDTLLAAAKVDLWVEQGWLCVRRMDADGAAEWQVVLAQPRGDMTPVVETDKLGGVEIAFGPYFVREHVGRVRMLRQRKDEQAMAWPKLEMSEPIES